MGAMDRISEALQLLRERKRMTLAQVAARTGLADKSSVQSVERGNPAAASIGRYLDALGATVHDLADALDEVNGRSQVKPAEQHAALSREAQAVASELLRELERANQSRALADIAERLARLGRRVTEADR